MASVIVHAEEDGAGPATPTRRAPIPRAVREQLWIAQNGRVFEAKCAVRWCKNVVTVFDFEAGHNVPASRGGSNDLANLRVICGNCNRSMGARYTLDEWDAVSGGGGGGGGAARTARCCAIA